MMEMNVDEIDEYMKKNSERDDCEEFI